MMLGLRITSPLQRPDVSCIYTLSDPSDGTVRYVGCCADPYLRYRGHVSDAVRAEVRPDKKQSWIKSLVVSGSFPTLDVVEVVDDAKAVEREQHYYLLHQSTIFNKQLPGKHPTRSHLYVGRRSRLKSILNQGT
jgi:hypothetical protein